MALTEIDGIIIYSIKTVTIKKPNIRFKLNIVGIF
jgi:DNA-binding CsgD family transcriptional regulator